MGGGGGELNEKSRICIHVFLVCKSLHSAGWGV
jgi:hypothetical protein